jgi:hypothetical protein
LLRENGNQIHQAETMLSDVRSAMVLLDRVVKMPQILSHIANPLTCVLGSKRPHEGCGIWKDDSVESMAADRWRAGAIFLPTSAVLRLLSLNNAFELGDALFKSLDDANASSGYSVNRICLGRHGVSVLVLLKKCMPRTFGSEFAIR